MISPVDILGENCCIPFFISDMGRKVFIFPKWSSNTSVSLITQLEKPLQNFTPVFVLILTSPHASSLSFHSYRPRKMRWPFFFFLLYCIFIAVGRFSLAAPSWGYSLVAVHASHCGGISCCRAQTLGTWTSVAEAHGLCSCGTQAEWPRSTWNLPRPGIKPVSPTLTGSFLITGPPGNLEVIVFKLGLESRVLSYGWQDFLQGL